MPARPLALFLAAVLLVLVALPAYTAAQPAALLFADNFDAGLRPEWRTSGGQWVAQNSRYEQTQLWGEALTWPEGVSCSACDVSAKFVMPSTGASSGEGSIGLVLRMSDVNNLYLADLHFSSQGVRLWKRVGGGWAPLVIKPFALSYDRAYVYRFVATGATLQVYVDGQLQIETTDATWGSGLAGLRASEAYATYDDFSISGAADSPPGATPTPSVNRLFTDGFDSLALDPRWEATGVWKVQNGALVQSLTGAYGNILAWPSALFCGDCSAVARVRVEGGAGREFGLVTRALDNDTYYMFDLREASSEARIWRRSNGDWHFLKGAPFDAEVSKWYELRFEAAGDRLRGYVDGRLIVEARDSALTYGRAGLRTGDAVARFDWFAVDGSLAPVTVTPTPRPATESYPDLDALYVQRAPSYPWNAEKNWPDVGEAVRFTLHLANKGALASGPFTVRWDTRDPSGALVPGSTVEQRVSGLAGGAQMTLEYAEAGKGRAWGDGRWRDGPYQVEVAVDSRDDVHEGPFEGNNRISDATNALGVAFKVEQRVYDEFNRRMTGVAAAVPPYNRPYAAFYWSSKPANTPPYRAGTYSWEDWAQRQIAQLNEYFYGDEDRYFGGQRNRLIRVRLDRVDIVPTGTMQGNHNFPYEADWSIDVAWGFEEWEPLYTVLSEFWVTEWSLLHELGHHMGRPHPNLTSGNVRLDGAALGYYPGDAAWAGSPMQNSDYSQGWREFDALGFAYEFRNKPGRGVPERIGSQNPGNGLWGPLPTREPHWWNPFLAREQANGWPSPYGIGRLFLYEVPSSPQLVVPGANGRWIPNAKVEIFRTRSNAAASSAAFHGENVAPAGNTGTWTFASPPDATGYTDAGGILRLESFNLWDRQGASWEAWGWIALARITYGGEQVYRVIDMTRANNAYRRNPARPDPIRLETALDGATIPFPRNGIETPVSTPTDAPTATPTPTPAARRVWLPQLLR